MLLRNARRVEVRGKELHEVLHRNDLCQTYAEVRSLIENI